MDFALRCSITIFLKLKISTDIITGWITRYHFTVRGKWELNIVCSDTGSRTENSLWAKSRNTLLYLFGKEIVDRLPDPCQDFDRFLLGASETPGRPRPTSYNPIKKRWRLW
jgi:hypothetical protein